MNSTPKNRTLNYNNNLLLNIMFGWDSEKEDDTSKMDKETQLNAIRGILNCKIEFNDRSEITQVNFEQLEKLHNLEAYDPSSMEDRRAMKYAKRHKDDLIYHVRINTDPPRIYLEQFYHKPETVKDENILDFIKTFRPPGVHTTFDVIGNDEPKMGIVLF